MGRTNLDGPTLAEKRYGKEYRAEVAQSFTVKSFEKCSFEGCTDRVECTMQVWVDDGPPAVDAVTRFLLKLFNKFGRAWVTAPFCIGHGMELAQYGLEYLDEPDLWAPHRESPPMFPQPVKMLPKAQLIVPGA